MGSVSCSAIGRFVSSFSPSKRTTNTACVLTISSVSTALCSFQFIFLRLCKPAEEAYLHSGSQVYCGLKTSWVCQASCVPDTSCSFWTKVTLQQLSVSDDKYCTFTGNSCPSLVNPMSLAEGGTDHEGVYLLSSIPLLLDCTSSSKHTTNALTFVLYVLYQWLQAI